MVSLHWVPHRPTDRPQSRPEPSGRVARVTPQSITLPCAPWAGLAALPERERTAHAQPEIAYSSRMRHAPACARGLNKWSSLVQAHEGLTIPGSLVHSSSQVIWEEVDVGLPVCTT